MNPDILSDAVKAADAAKYIAQRLDTLSEEYERGWHGEPTSDGGLKFWREVRGVREAVAIDGALIASADARKLDKMAGELTVITLSAKIEPRRLRHMIYDDQQSAAVIAEWLGQQAVKLRTQFRTEIVGLIRSRAGCIFASDRLHAAVSCPFKGRRNRQR
jgi:hypothetical protein